MMRPRLLVFDVNETLLDVGVLKPVFAEALGDAAAIGEWFARLLHGSLVANHTAGYRSFGEIAREALAATAAHRNLTLEDDTFDTVIGGMLRLPAHPDVTPALTRLRDAGYRLVTLTNGSPQTATAQLAAAAIAGHFQAGYTVEPVERFKPDPAPYLQVLEQEAVKPGEVMMVAAHDWDVVGARRVGMAGAFVNRPGTRWNLGPHQPDLTVTDLTELANVLT